MLGFPFIPTKAGRAALVNAEHNGTASLTIDAIGITAAVFTANDDMTALPGEIKRLKSISGEIVAADTMHVIIRDDSHDTYTVRGIGYWLSNGVLFGVYSQPEPILEKSTQSMMLLAADVTFTDCKVTALSFGNANFTNPPASTERQGVAELATADETVDGEDSVRVVTPAGLKLALAKTIATHEEAPDPHTQYLNQTRGDERYLLGYTPTKASGAHLNSVAVADERATSYAPADRNAGAFFDFTDNDVGELHDGGVQHGAFTFRPWGVGADFSGGPAHQLGFTANGNLQYRSGKDNQWGPWHKLYHVGNLPEVVGKYLPLTGGNVDGMLSIAAAVASPSYATPGLEIRESCRDGGANGRHIDYAPKMSFHWGSICVTQLRLTADNVLEVVGGDGASYGAFQAGSINATADMTVGGRLVWHAGNFNPGDKISGSSNIRLNWEGRDGQPHWMVGGDDPGNVGLYHVRSFHVRYADNTANASNADKVGGVPMRWAENPGVQPYYLYGVVAGNQELTLFNRTEVAVGSAVTAVYAHQLTGQGLQRGTIGSIELNKNKSSSGWPGVWEQHGTVYDYGSGAAEGNESSSVLWQRIR